MKSKIEKVKTYWDFLSNEKAMKRRKATNMSGLALMHEYHNYLVTGDKNVHYLKYFFDKYFKNREIVAASIGCGSGHLERELHKMEIPIKEINGFEINPNLVEFAKDKAKEIGFHQANYVEADANSIILEKGKYNLVIFFHSLHHVENLEHCLAEVAKSLIDDGILLIVDFVGPTRFQWTEKQLKYAQQMLDILPENLKVDLSKESGGRVVKNLIIRQKPEEIEAGDPSEAVRSADIMDHIGNRFDILEKKPLGGTVLNLVLADIAGNFNESDECHSAIIKSLQKTEEMLVGEDILSPDYLFLVAKAKK